MPAKLLLPAEATLTKWLKKEGERVSSGDMLATIDTDKVTMEIEAIGDGKLGRILIPEGTERIPINTPIALMLEGEEDESVLEEVIIRTWQWLDECKQRRAGTKYVGGWNVCDERVYEEDEARPIYAEKYLSTLMKCPACDEKVSVEAKDCPHCGHPLKADDAPSVPTVSVDWGPFFIILFKLIIVIAVVWFIAIPVGLWLIKLILKAVLIGVITG